MTEGGEFPKDETDKLVDQFRSLADYTVDLNKTLQAHNTVGAISYSSLVDLAMRTTAQAVWTASVLGMEFAWMSKAVRVLSERVQELEEVLVEQAVSQAVDEEQKDL